MALPLNPRTPFQGWMAEVCKVAQCKIDPADDPSWELLYKDGYTPAEAVEALNEED